MWVGSGKEKRQRRDDSSWPPSTNSCASGVFDPATYSQGVRVSQAQTMLFLSGQVAYTPDGGVACRGDFKGQARGAFEAIKALVESRRAERWRAS